MSSALNDRSEFIGVKKKSFSLILQINTGRAKRQVKQGQFSRSKDTLRWRDIWPSEAQMNDSQSQPHDPAHIPIPRGHRLSVACRLVLLTSQGEGSRNSVTCTRDNVQGKKKHRLFTWLLLTHLP